MFHNVGALKKNLNKSGSVSIEFALLLPFMVLFFISTVSILNIVACYQKVHITARAIADMVAQNATDTITPAEIDEIRTAGTLTLWPFDASLARLTVTSFSQNNKSGAPTVLWSRGDEPRAIGTSVSTAKLENFSTERQGSFIYSEVKYDDRNIISQVFNVITPAFLSAQITMTPRNVDTITCPNC